MRQGNDVAGLLFGDHASLLITKVFVDLGLSPNFASIGFFVAGLAGAGLQLLDGGWALAGALCLVLYYVLDCVDGEVARWQKVVALQWSYYDYLFHLLIKPLAFLGVGLGVSAAAGDPRLLVAAFTAAVATLWLKIFRDIPALLFVREVLERGRNVLAETPVEPQVAAAPPPLPFHLRFDLVTLRALLTNFDVGILYLTIACTADALLPPGGAPWVGGSWRAVWLLYYGAILPLDFIDHLWTDLRGDRFRKQMARMSAQLRRRAVHEQPGALDAVGATASREEARERRH